MNAPALKIVLPPPETLESLCTEITRLKHEESVIAARLQSIEKAIIALVGAREEGAQTTTLTDGRKLTVTGKLIYSADMALLTMLAATLPPHLSPVKLVRQLDAAGAKWLRSNDPEHWAMIARAITIKPAKTSVTVKAA